MVDWRWGRGVWGSVSSGEEKLAAAVAGAEKRLGPAIRKRRMRLCSDTKQDCE
jgi:hypothetical protein